MLGNIRDPHLFFFFFNGLAHDSRNSTANASGFCSLSRHCFISIGIPIINLRRSDDRLSFINGDFYTARQYLLSERGPGVTTGHSMCCTDSPLPAAPLTSSPWLLLAEALAQIHDIRQDAGVGIEIFLFIWRPGILLLTLLGGGSTLAGGFFLFFLFRLFLGFRLLFTLDVRYKWIKLDFN